jgi:glycosyltransferase involved in cell wall biosynthesis
MPERVRVMRIIARLNVGGPALHVVLLTAALNDACFESVLVTGMVGPDEGDMTYAATQRGVTPLIIPALGREISPLADLHSLARLIGLMRRYRPHVVHTHTAKAGFLGRLAARLSGVPVVVHTFHGHVFHGYFGKFKSGLYIALERLAARLSDRIITLSDGLRDELVGYRIAPTERFEVVPLGLDLGQLTSTSLGEWRRELGVAHDAPLVGIVGRLVPVKNHALFLQMAARVRARLPEARFVIVGDGELRADLEALAEALGLAEAVVFAGWQQDLAPIYADLDALVIASRNEGTPVSVIEAMAARVPVVATRVGGLPDLLCGGRFGALVAPDDAEAMVEAVLDALRARLDTPARLEAARTHALANHGSEALTARLRDLYVDLLRSKGALAPDWHDLVVPLEQMAAQR